MTKAMLERMGYRVTALTDGSEALEVFTRDPDGFNLVLTDQTMPEMTGIALAKEVLAVKNDVSVMLYTGYGESSLPEKAKEAGIRELMMKPATREEMGEAVRRVLEQGKDMT